MANRNHRSGDLKTLPDSARQTAFNAINIILNRIAMTWKGRYAEDITEEALTILKEEGILDFKRSEHFDWNDRHGIDFAVWGVGKYKCGFTIDVKSSPIGVAHSKSITRARGTEHHYPLLVTLDVTPYDVAAKILQIFKKEARAKKVKTRIENMPRKDES